jgi:hypothetical protein
MMGVLHPLRVARVVKIGFAALFGLAGVVRFLLWVREFNGVEGIMTSLLLALTGLGLTLNWRWARWLTMGACFLAIVVACVTPLILLSIGLLDHIPPRSARPLFALSIVAAIGYVGFKGLQYFRSELALQEFATRGSSSKFILYSAFTCLSLGIVLLVFRINYEFDAEKRTRQAAAAAQARDGRLPDLLVTRLCLHGEALVKAEIETRGAASLGGMYAVTFTDLNFRDVQDGSAMRVPKAGGRGLVSLSRAVNPTDEESRRLAVTVEVDARRKLRESNERNNVSHFVIEFEGHRPANLPSCKSISGPKGIPSLDPN